MITANDLLKLSQETPAPSMDAPQGQQPRIVYVQAPAKSGGSLLTFILSVAIVGGGLGMLIGNVRITPSIVTQPFGPSAATSAPANTAGLFKIPTASVRQLPPPAQEVQVQPAAAPIVIATSAPVPAAAPIVAPVQDAIVYPTPAAEPVYQTDPNQANGTEAQTTGQYEGWGGGGGSGWVIPEPQAVQVVQAKPASVAAPTAQPAPKETGWGGGGGSGWSDPTPDAANNGWSIGN